MMHIFHGFLFLACAQLGLPLNCPQNCHSAFCVDRNKINSFCKSGVTIDSCGCCFVCAKKVDEICGGHLDVFGRCRTGLLCHSNNRFGSNFGTCIQPLNFENITRPVITRPVFVEIANEPTKKVIELEKCKPKCSRNYCYLNPNAICSASENALKKRVCRGDCQHTSCSVCFIKKKMTCPKCLLNDFKCIENYAKCVRQNTHKRWSNKFQLDDNQSILCRVPDCPK
ncbi:cysteine-rich motor neuron 1 protein [Hydra vulgaris]|uniref:cysteine-rich motor neuron 1 protein n=1 Tax=Hydra vulgaris TaxID=6087 RepID=UPI001F5E60DD|nr:cysteine-rich motor neuron 1 protein [Hydra vulgaris]